MHQRERVELDGKNARRIHPLMNHLTTSRQKMQLESRNREKKKFRFWHSRSNSQAEADIGNGEQPSTPKLRLGYRKRGRLTDSMEEPVPSFERPLCVRNLGKPHASSNQVNEAYDTAIAFMDDTCSKPEAWLGNQPLPTSLRTLRKQDKILVRAAIAVTGVQATKELDVVDVAHK